jgi:hypothetical protein
MAFGAAGGRGGGLDRAGGQVEPLPLAIPEGGQADPVEDGGFVPREVEIDGGGRAVQEVQPAVAARSLQEKAAHPRAGRAGQRLLDTGQGVTHQLDQSLGQARHLTAQPEQSLAVPAETLDADCHCAPVWPEQLVTLVAHSIAPVVAPRVAAEANGEGAWHTREAQTGGSGVTLCAAALEVAFLAELSDQASNQHDRERSSVSNVFTRVVHAGNRVWPLQSLGPLSSRAAGGRGSEASAAPGGAARFLTSCGRGRMDEKKGQ